MSPSWDLVLLVFGGASVVYSLMLREKVVVTVLAAYAAIIVADRWGVSLYKVISEESGEFLKKPLLDGGELSIFTVQVVLFAVTMLVIALRGGVLIHPESVGRGFFSIFFLIAYGLATATMIASAIIGFMPPDYASQLYESSVMAKQLVDYQAWLLIAPLILMIVSGWGHRD